MITRLLLLALFFCSFSLLRAQTVDLSVDAGPVDYLTPGTHSFWIGGIVVSGGFSNLNALQAGWSFNGSPWEVHNATTPVFTPQGKRFPVNMAVTPTITVNAPGQYVLKIFIKSSTISDPDIVNDTLTKIIRVHNSLPPKNVLFEVMKFQACTPCYPGDTAVNGQILPKPYVNVARNYIVPGEPLYNASGDTVDNWIAFLPGHPSYMYDRFRWPYASTQAIGLNSQTGTTTYIPDTGNRVRFLEPLSVAFDQVLFDSATRKLTVRLQASIFDTLVGDHRFNLFVTEDSIQSWQSGAPGGTYMHHRVVRTAGSGSWGTANSLPTPLLPGSTHQHTYEYNIPSAYKLHRLRIVGFVQEFNGQDTFKRRILNSVGGSMSDLVVATGVSSTGEAAILNLYPNPASDHVTFGWDRAAALRLRLLDASGRILREWYDRGTSVNISLADVPAGTYLLDVTDGKERMVGRLVVLD